MCSAFEQTQKTDTQKLMNNALFPRNVNFVFSAVQYLMHHYLHLFLLLLITVISWQITVIYLVIKNTF
jgi:hypothetical protein